jgi:hypothetical protein
VVNPLDFRRSSWTRRTNSAWEIGSTKPLSNSRSRSATSASDKSASGAANDSNRAVTSVARSDSGSASATRSLS